MLAWVGAVLDPVPMFELEPGVMKSIAVIGAGGTAYAIVHQPA
jgi:shikimate 5-dehydrogenase